MTKYKIIAQHIRKIVADFDPEFECLGLDEAYMNITPYMAEHGLVGEEGAASVAFDLRKRIHD
jgi:hypothetical protein